MQSSCCISSPAADASPKARLLPDLATTATREVPATTSAESNLVLRHIVTPQDPTVFSLEQHRGRAIGPAVLVLSCDGVLQVLIVMAAAGVCLLNQHMRLLRRKPCTQDSVYIMLTAAG
jgi:hypothetical protein